MDSIASSKPSAFLKTAARAAAEGAVIASIGAFAARSVWTGAPDRRGLAIGIAAAWFASSASVAWLLWARDRSSKSFWWAFGGGMVLRLLVLTAVAFCTYKRPSTSFEAALLSYVFALLGLLLTLEMRHFKIR